MKPSFPFSLQGPNFSPVPDDHRLLAEAQPFTANVVSFAGSTFTSAPSTWTQPFTNICVFTGNTFNTTTSLNTLVQLQPFVGREYYIKRLTIRPSLNCTIRVDYPYDLLSTGLYTRTSVHQLLANTDFVIENIRVSSNQYFKVSLYSLTNTADSTAITVYSNITEGYDETDARDKWKRFNLLNIGDSTSYHSNLGSSTYYPDNLWNFQLANYFTRQGYSTSLVNWSLAGKTLVQLTQVVKMGRFNSGRFNAFVELLGINDANPSLFSGNSGTITTAGLQTVYDSITFLLNWSRQNIPGPKIFVAPNPIQPTQWESNLALVRQQIQLAIDDWLNTTANKIAGAIDPSVLFIDLGGSTGSTGKFMSNGTPIFDKTVYANYSGTETTGNAIHPAVTSQPLISNKIIASLDNGGTIVSTLIPKDY